MTKAIHPLAASLCGSRMGFSVIARVFLLVGAFFVGLNPASAADETKKAFDIPAGTAPATLKEFSSQAGGHLLYTNKAVDGVATQSVKGEMTAREALERMLMGTPLSAVADGKNGALSIVRDDSTEAKNVSRAIAETAKNDRPEQSVRTEKIGGEEVVKMPDYMVKGAKTLNADIQRTENDPLHYVVFDRSAIETSNAATVEDFFRMRVPMNTQAGSTDQMQNFGATQGRVSQINLRGLGVTQTLILIDGRRAPRLLSGGASDFTQADVNGIPMSAIERIEVLPGSAGGIYGGGATGGVINIVRKRNYRGLELEVSHQGVFGGAGDVTRVNLTGGLSLNNGKTQMNWSASISESYPLHVEDNDLWSRSLALAVAYAPTNLPTGATPNIRSNNGATLVLDNGTSLNSSFTSIPSGYLGIGTDSGAALVTNAGKYNLDLSPGGRAAPLTNAGHVRALNVGATHQFSEHIEVFLNSGIYDNKSRVETPVNGGVSFSATATGNPFQQPITVSVPYTIFTETNTLSRAEEITGGLILGLPRKWRLTAEYDWNRANLVSTYTSAPLSGTYLTDVTSGSLNIFRDVVQSPLNYSPYLTPTPDTTDGPNINRQEVASIRVAGPLLVLPAGSINMTGLVEHRSEVAEPEAILKLSGGSSYRPRRSQAADSEYIEFTVPIVSETQRLFAVRSLDLQLAGRHDSYSTRVLDPSLVPGYVPGMALPNFTDREARVASTDFTAAAMWRLDSNFALRTSVATGFLPPSLAHVVPSTGPGQTGVLARILGPFDPKRGGQGIGVDAPYVQTGGGNPDLQPELSRTISLGTRITPSLVPGLVLSIDYTSIEKRNEIFLPTPQFILDNEASYPGRIVRSANLVTDPTGWAGPVTSINNTYINASKTWVQALDFQMDYQRTFSQSGSIRVYAMGTHQTEFRRKLLPTLASFNTVDFRDGPLPWRGNVGLDWGIGRWTLGWNTQYFHSYSLRNGSGPTSSTSNRLVAEHGGIERIPMQMYSDFYVKYRVRRNVLRFFSGYEITAGIQNVANARPPAMASTGVLYSPYGDPRLRRFTLSVRASLGN